MLDETRPMVAAPAAAIVLRIGALGADRAVALFTAPARAGNDPGRIRLRDRRCRPLDDDATVCAVLAHRSVTADVGRLGGLS